MAIRKDDFPLWEVYIKKIKYKLNKKRKERAKITRNKKMISISFADMPTSFTNIIKKHQRCPQSCLPICLFA